MLMVILLGTFMFCVNMAMAEVAAEFGLLHIIELSGATGCDTQDAVLPDFPSLPDKSEFTPRIIVTCDLTCEKQITLDIYCDGKVYEFRGETNAHGNQVANPMDIWEIIRYFCRVKNCDRYLLHDISILSNSYFLFKHNYSDADNLILGYKADSGMWYLFEKRARPELVIFPEF